jgi:LacI family transcriptional regulator
MAASRDNPPDRPQRTVALLVESSRSFGRGLLHGIARYVRAHGHWLVLHEERMLGAVAPAWLSRRPCDGILARIDTPALLKSIRKRGVPTVDLLGRLPAPGVPQVRQGHAAIARMAGEHLRQRGFRQFAYCGFTGAGYSVARRDAFVAWARAAGFEPQVYEDAPADAAADTSTMEATGGFESKGLAGWVRGLPRPSAVMACNDARGLQVLAACRACNVRVPDEVAVIGVDNDDVVCDLAVPPLSSVVPPTDRIGYAGAALLDRMMGGEPPPAEPLVFDPPGVVTRMSTDTLAVQDARVAAALRIIRDRACEGLNVDGVLGLLGDQALPVSRSTLERRFADLLGHSPKDEILRVRLARVKQLLIDTDHSLVTIARLVGVENHEYLSALFKIKTGETPGNFRKRMGPLR